MKNNTKTFVTGVEKKFRKAVSNMRQLDRKLLTVEETKNLAYLINDVEKYGFNFFPNVYVWDNVDRLTKYVRHLSAKQKGE